MEKTLIYPLTFTPQLRDYIWGGRNLENYGRSLPEGITSESWEVSAHKNGSATVLNGLHQGKSLADLTEELGIDLIGANAQWALERGKFPLLVKLIDANQSLSVQVHPDDGYAQEHESNELGKTEMWVILHAEPEAMLVYGVKANTTPENFKEGILNGNLEPYLHTVPVKTGDHICVPAGSLHAIMEGTIVAEIQQNSDTTYRVYDWNRVGIDGNPRPLHIEKALDVIDFEQVEPEICAPGSLPSQPGHTRFMLCENEYFITEKVVFEGSTPYQGECDGTSLEIWGLLEGTAEINTTPLKAIQFTLLPAAMGSFSIKASSGAVLLRTTVPLRN